MNHEKIAQKITKYVLYSNVGFMFLLTIAAFVLYGYFNVGNIKDKIDTLNPTTSSKIKIERIIDGDTLEATIYELDIKDKQGFYQALKNEAFNKDVPQDVNISLSYITKKAKIRIFGIDAPEIKQEYGKDAKQFLEKLCLNQEAKFVPKSIDRYQREVGIVYCNNLDAGQKLVSQGLAYAYTQYSKKYLPDELLAKTDKRGVWIDEDPLRPEEFRKAKKEEQEKNENNQSLMLMKSLEQRF